MTILPDARREAEAERRERILALPKFTLMLIGWEIEPGRVQGGIYYRIGRGLGPTGRDTTTEDVLRRAAYWGGNERGQEWGIQVLASPPSGGEPC